MTEYEIVRKYVAIEDILQYEFGYIVHAQVDSFLVYNNDSEWKILASLQTVDGLVGFLDGLRSVRNEA